MDECCPYCDPSDLTALRLVVIRELIGADETVLLRVAAVMQQCGLLQLDPEPEASHTTLAQARQATLRYLRQPPTNTP